MIGMAFSERKLKKGRAECPSCESHIPIGKARMGQKVVCPVCKEKLEVVWLNPIELDWPLDDYDPYDEYEISEEFEHRR